jgi:putative ABC transport system permease protein
LAIDGISGCCARPREFRDEFGGEMMRLYRDRRRDERWWELRADLLVDLVRTAPSQHLSMLTQDLRDAWRGPRRTPVVAITAILIVALGVGASTAVFSVVQAVLLRPLPYPMRTSWSSCSKPISRHPRESRR